MALGFLAIFPAPMGVSQVAAPPAATRLVSLGLPANPHHPWPAQPDHERSHSGRYGAPASAKSSCSTVHFNMCSFGPVTLNRLNVRSTLILRSETRMEFL